MWQSKLATEICLSTTEAKYVLLSMALHETISMMQLLIKARDQGIKGLTLLPNVMCKAFEDNSGALEMARMPKMRPCTKHINCKYHHFREFVTRRLIILFAVRTEDQQADMFTKSLGYDLFVKFRKSVMGW